MGRYAEYITSKGTKTPSSKGFLNISSKVANFGDDSYYALGMAQIMVINQLDIKDWQQKLLYENGSPEDLLREYIREQ